MPRAVPIVCIVLAGLVVLAAPAKATSVDVSGTGDWVDTGLDLRSGDQLNFTATGTLNLASGRSVDPQGQPRGFRDVLKAYPVNDAGLGALIGRVGSQDTAQPFLIGLSKHSLRALLRAGRLFLSVNKSGNDSPDGTFTVQIDFVSRGPEPSAPPLDLKLPVVTQSMIDRIPRRVKDDHGDPGDNTKFLVEGNEDKVLALFEAGGWVKVDRNRKGAVLSGLLATLTKQAYLTLPMSELTLFGRVQDYGLAHAEPIQVVAQRHHLRLWKAPFQVEGQELWVGAATHDIGFDRDQRNNGLTHKIDPNIDDEREFVGRSLDETGLVAKLSYITPAQPSTEARTATGATFHSDGRVLVVRLIPDNPVTAAPVSLDALKFANLFCTVLQRENPAGGDWGECNQYLEAAAEKSVELRAISNRYRVLIVPGFFGLCTSSMAPVFAEGQEHLRSAHGLTVEMWTAPNASSEANAHSIAQYLRDHMQSDRRKYIVIGYSKGAADLQVTLAEEPGAKDAVAAFVAVAGAVGGSPLADLVPAQLDRFLDRFKAVSCQGSVSTALNSLRRSVRQAFLAAHPNPEVPSYSLPAVSDRTNTSKILLDSWQILAAFAPRQDSQLAYRDAVLPGSTLLGAARADHLAVAQGFDKSADGMIRNLVDKGHYPRAALLESIVRFVTADLDGR